MKPTSIDAYMRAMSTALRAREPDKQAILDEITDHLREAAAAHVARGLSQAEAESAALAQFGDVQVVSRRLVLQRAVESGRRNLWMTAIVNGIVALTVVAYWGSSVWADPRGVTIFGAAGSIVFGIAVVAYYALHARRGSRDGANLESSMHTVALARFKIVSSGRYQLAGFGAFAAVWSVWKIVADMEFYAARPWAAVIGFGGMIAIGTALAVLFRRARTRARAALDAAATAGGHSRA